MASTYPVVSYGSTGDPVLRLQQALNQVGYTLDEDGVFGEKTKAAVVDYQRNNGLRVDGEAGSQTMGSLLGKLMDGAAVNPAGDTTSKQVLSGVSDETADRLAVLEQGYRPSDEVLAAQAEQQSIAALQPGEYQSGFEAQLSALYDQLASRPGFSYDPAQDAAYQSYAALYQRQGKAAMADTLGKAAALTGGYGSSYAQSTAQQAYSQYLQALNEVLPQLQQQAYARYSDQGDALAQQYALVQARQQAEYEQWQDEQKAWEQALERAAKQTETLQKQDVNAYETMLGYFADKAAAEQKASAGARVNSGKQAEVSVQKESLSSTAAESLQRAMRNYLKAGDSGSAAALYQQYAARMTPAQKKTFDALLSQYGAAV